MTKLLTKLHWLQCHAQLRRGSVFVFRPRFGILVGLSWGSAVLLLSDHAIIFALFSRDLTFNRMVTAQW